MNHKGNKREDGICDACDMGELTEQECHSYLDTIHDEDCNIKEYNGDVYLVEDGMICPDNFDKAEQYYNSWKERSK